MCTWVVYEIELSRNGWGTYVCSITHSRLILCSEVVPVRFVTLNEWFLDDYSFGWSTLNEYVPCSAGTLAWVWRILILQKAAVCCYFFSVCNAKPHCQKGAQITAEGLCLSSSFQLLCFGSPSMCHTVTLHCLESPKNWRLWIAVYVTSSCPTLKASSFHCIIKCFIAIKLLVCEGFKGNWSSSRS